MNVKSALMAPASRFLMPVLGVFAFGVSLLAGPPAVDGRLNPKIVSANSAGNVVTVMAAARQADGKLVIVGQFTSVNGVARLNIARLNVDGSVDAGFDPNPNRISSVLRGVLVQPDGKLVVHGEFSNFRPNKGFVEVNRPFCARLNEDGSVDESFDLGLDNRVYGAALQADGKLIIAGGFSTVKGAQRSGMARISLDGSLDTGFDPKLDGFGNCVAVQPDGKILIGGGFNSMRPNGAVSYTARLNIARVTAAGDLDASFDPSADGTVDSLTLQADGKILVGGRFSSFSPNGVVPPISRQNYARLNANGTVDTSVRVDLSGDPGSTLSVWTSAVQADGKFLIAGTFDRYVLDPAINSVPVTQKGLLRFDGSGAFDSGFNAALNQQLFGVSLDGDGSILTVGNFTKVAGAARIGIARLQNSASTQSLAVTGTTKVEWQRGGSAALVSWAVFEKSVDNGATWTTLGEGTPVGTTANWELTGLSLPANCAIRVRGAVPGGKDNASSSLVEQVALAPEVGTDVATQITPNSAVLSGMVTANGFATNCSFQYSTDPTLATGVTTVPAQSLPSDGINVMVSKPVTGLPPHTDVYFRIVAQNFAGVSEGGIASFTTLNSGPFAADDAILLDETASGPQLIDVLANDFDVDIDSLTITILSKPKNGTVAVNNSAPGNKIIYTPGTGYATSGKDSFTYEVVDGHGGTAKGKVTLTTSPFAMRAGLFAGALTGPGASVEGTLTLTLTKTGSFSATVLFAGGKKTVKGVFDGNGDFASTDGLVNLHIDLATATGGPGSFAISGTLKETAGGPQLALSGKHAAYAASTLPPESGVYTVLLENPGTTPGGTGWAKMTVGKGGSVDVEGKLSDGTTLSCSATIVGGSGVGNVAHFSAALSYPVKGSLTGQVAFNETLPGSDCSGVLRWIKPPQTKGTLYVGGFDVTNLDFAASRYTAPEKGVRVLPFENRTPNGTITLSDGSLAAPIAKDLLLATTNGVIITSTNTEAVVVKINAAKGIFAGTFLQQFLPATKAVKVPFGGVIYQKRGRAAGFFLSPTASGGVDIAPKP